jgi:prevent-host-death family protein
MVMEEISISEFKAKCLAILERVNKTKKPVRVTRFGKPIADVGPVSPISEKKNRLGRMKGTATITGDIISPVIDMNEFEAWRD